MCSCSRWPTPWPTWSAATPAPTGRSRRTRSLRPSGLPVAVVTDGLEPPRNRAGTAGRGVFRSGAERVGRPRGSPSSQASLASPSSASRSNRWRRSALGRFAPEWQRVSRPARPEAGRAGRSDPATPRRRAGRLGPRARRPPTESGRPRSVASISSCSKARWCGPAAGPLGGRDGKVALYLPVPARALWTPPAAESSERGSITTRSGPTSTASGASFFHDLYQAAGGGDPEVVLDSLWDLVWAGEVTNDTLAPLRAYVSTRRGPPTRWPGPLPLQLPAPCLGRWSRLVDPERADHVGHRLGRTSPRPSRPPDQVPRRRRRSPGGFDRALSGPQSNGGGRTGRRGLLRRGPGRCPVRPPRRVDRLRSPLTTPHRRAGRHRPRQPLRSILPWPETEVRLPERRGARHPRRWRVAGLSRPRRSAPPPL